MNAVELVKDLVKVGQNLQDIELFKKIVALQGEVFELDAANRELKKRVAELEEAAALRAKLTFEKNLYWLKDGNNIEGPFCTRCYDKESAVRRMISDSGRAFACPTCLLVFDKEGLRPNDAMLDRIQHALKPPKLR
jgi:hypothetical protein